MEGGDFVAFGIDDDAGEVGRFFRRCEGFEIDAIEEAGDEVATLGIDGEIDGLQEDGNGFGGGFDDAAIFDEPGECAFAAGDERWEFELGGAVAVGINFRYLAMDFDAVNAGDGGDFCADGCAAFGAVDVKRGAGGVAGALAVAEEDGLRFEARGAVGADVEFALAGGIAEEGVGDFYGVFATRG